METSFLLPLLLTAAAVGFYWTPTAAAFLEYNRSSLAQGQLWRVVSGHFTHWSLDHLIGSAGAYLLLALATRRQAWIQTSLLAALTIPLGIWIWNPQIGRYRGLSGIDSALFALLVVGWLLPVTDSTPGSPPSFIRRSIGTVCLVGFLVKLAYELTTGQAIWVDSAGAGFVPLPLAHLLGAIAGTSVAIWESRRHS